MYKTMIEDFVAVNIYKDDVLLHEVGCLDGEHEVILINGLADGICQQMNNQPDLAWVGKALWHFLHALDGQLTLGEIVVLMEKITRSLAPINR